MWWSIAKTCLSAVIITLVSGVSQRYPRAGALILSLPMVSLLAFVFTWTDCHDIPATSRLARETLILVPLGLPLFVPLAFADRFGLGFWPAFLSGIVLASTSIGIWLWLSPSSV